jgi:hypothetical protein
VVCADVPPAYCEARERQRGRRAGRGIVACVSCIHAMTQQRGCHLTSSRPHPAAGVAPLCCIVLLVLHSALMFGLRCGSDKETSASSSISSAQLSLSEFKPLLSYVAVDVVSHRLFVLPTASNPKDFASRPWWMGFLCLGMVLHLASMGQYTI